MKKSNLSSRGARIVKALDRLADDLDSGEPMDLKYTVRTVRVIPEPSIYPPARVRAVRKLIGASQDVFARLLAVSPMTIRSWEQGLRQPSPIARRFLDEIEMSPRHFRGRILASTAGAAGVTQASRALDRREQTDAGKRPRRSPSNHE
jgi:putative transcriptional regulator